MMNTSSGHHIKFSGISVQPPLRNFSYFLPLGPRQRWGAPFKQFPGIRICLMIFSWLYYSICLGTLHREYAISNHIVFKMICITMTLLLRLSLQPLAKKAKWQVSPLVTFSSTHVDFKRKTSSTEYREGMESIVLLLRKRELPILFGILVCRMFAYFPSYSYQHKNNHSYFIP